MMLAILIPLIAWVLRPAPKPSPTPSPGPMVIDHLKHARTRVA